jgi:hypothetical protein
MNAATLLSQSAFCYRPRKRGEVRRPHIKWSSLFRVSEWSPCNLILGKLKRESTLKNIEVFTVLGVRLEEERF